MNAMLCRAAASAPRSASALLHRPATLQQLAFCEQVAAPVSGLDLFSIAWAGPSRPPRAGRLLAQPPNRGNWSALGRREEAPHPGGCSNELLSHSAADVAQSVAGEIADVFAAKEDDCRYGGRNQGLRWDRRACHQLPSGKTWSFVVAGHGKNRPVLGLQCALATIGTKLLVDVLLRLPHAGAAQGVGDRFRPHRRRLRFNCR
jgi:hypothetical protein